MNGVTFEINGIAKNSDTDFDMIMEPVDIPFPEIKTKYVEKEFGDGSIDLTDADGNVYYKDRKFTLKFIVQNKALYKAKLNALSAFLHGQKVKMTFWYEQEYYYIGRLQINNYKSNEYIGEIDVDVQVRPYKYKQDVTVKNESSTAEYVKYTYSNDRMPAVPTFKCSGEGQLKFNNNEYSLSANTEVIFPNVIFKNGNNDIYIKGDGMTWEIKYQEGAI